MRIESDINVNAQATGAPREVRGREHTLSRRLAACLLFSALQIFIPLASAQEYDFTKLPVLNPKPDFNGVDATLGSYSTVSPLSFSAPGARHLNFTTLFNSRRESFSLNIYLADHTYRPAPLGYGGDRHLRVHLGGLDRLFVCSPAGGLCWQDVTRDGSRLERVSTDVYVYTDKSGARYTFFPLVYWQLPECTVSEYSTCNLAGFNAEAYVSSIVYPSGEKLSYSPYSSRVWEGSQRYQVNTIQSNLGYTLELKSTVASSGEPPTLAGLSWFPYGFGDIGIGASQTVFTLYRGTEQINTLTVDRYFNYSGPNTPSTLDVTHRDDLGRRHEIRYQGGYVRRPLCGEGGYLPYMEDHTPLVPVREKSPGGRLTSIGYHMMDPADWGFQKAAGDGNTSIPVNTLTRGGYTWRYDNVANRKTLTDPYNGTRTVDYWGLHDSSDPPISASCTAWVSTIISAYRDEMSRRTEYRYVGGLELLDGATLPEGNGYDYDYDDRGNLIRITQLAKPGSTEPNRVMFQAGYPACDSTNLKLCNKPAWVQNAKGNRTDYTYDPVHGGVLTVTQPAQPNGVRPQARYSYTAHDTGDGTIWRQTGSSLCTQGSSCDGMADELETLTTYWANTFLPATVTQRAGNLSVSATESFTYASAGRVTTATDALGRTTHYFYDAVGRKVGEIGPDPDGAGPLPRLATRTTYNLDDQPTRVETGTTTTTGVTQTDLNALIVTKWSAMSYDSLGRKIEERSGVDSETYILMHYSYDAWNRLICSAERMNLSNPPADACTTSTGPGGMDRITKNVYDAAGQLKQIIRAYGTPLQQIYAAYGYSPNGKQTAVIDANNNSAKLQYDGYDRQTHWFFPSTTKGSLTHSTTDFEQYGYDANDNRTTLRRRNGYTLSFDYDNLDRPIRKTVPERPGLDASHSRDVFYGYDNRGLQGYARFDSDTGQGLTQAFDALGRMQHAVINLDGISRQLDYAYNANGLRSAVTHPDNHTFTYSHDALDRLTGIMHPSAGTLAAYTYENKGRLDRINGGATTNYVYDSLGRVTSLQHDLAGTANDNTYGYEYLPSSQIKRLATSNTTYAPVMVSQTASYTVNGLNQYTAVSGAAHTYDANGNLTSDGQTLYIYDQENRLVKATTTGGALKAELRYDPLGRLNKVEGPSSTTTFLYDGDELVVEYNGTTVTQRYVHGISMDDPVAWFAGTNVDSGNRRHLRANHQGSIVAITDSAGNMLQLPRYDNWGKPQSAPPLRFGYTGQAWIPELGLWHYKARFYSAELGRFLQTDPVGYKDQINLYAYVGNDPMNYMDPTGQVDVGACSTYGGCAQTGNRPLTTSEQVILGVAVGGPLVGGLAVEGTLMALGNPLMANELGIVAAEIAGGDALGAGTLAMTTAAVSAKQVQATQESIKVALSGSPMRTAQNAISQPAVERYAQRLAAGEQAPPIKVDGDVIVDGNHRYAAGRLLGQEPATIPGTLAPSQSGNVKQIEKIKIDPVDWGNF